MKQQTSPAAVVELGIGHILKGSAGLAAISTQAFVSAPLILQQMPLRHPVLPKPFLLAFFLCILDPHL
jgi:hypothetical protein